MIPEILLQMIKARGEDFNPSVPHPLYTQYRDTWQTYLDLMELDETKLRAMLVKHGETEQQPLYEMRQKLAAVFNYVPTIIKMSVNYLFSEQPVISAEDNDLKEFIADATGSGTSFEDYIRAEVLPLALVFGMIDTLVQNPSTDDTLFVTKADEEASPIAIKPRVHTITPLQRVNWSTRPNHAYNWTCFTDTLGDDANPFYRNVTMPVEYVTISRKLEVDGIPITDETASGHTGFWVRSNKPIDKDGTPSDDWVHDGGWLPTAEVPIETLYYIRSLDPNRKHFGISKIAAIAVLTRKIIQLLSWTDEDVLSNLAIFVFPGNQPMNAEGTEKVDVSLTPFSVLWLGADVKVPPQVVQGSTSHIEMKMKIIDAYIREILRIAFLIGASAEAEQITSGVQGVVSRNELFMELREMAGALDRYSLGIFAHVKSWATDKPVTVAELPAGTKVEFYKGNYATEPLANVIANTNQLLETFRSVSPTMLKSMYEQLAQAALYNEESQRQAVYDEIGKHFEIEKARIEAESKVEAIAEAETLIDENADADLAGDELATV